MPSLVSLADAHQDRLLARADRSADAAERAVRQVWLAVLAAIKAGGPPHVVHAAVRHALRQLPAVAGVVRADLAGVAIDSARWSAATIAGKLTRRQRARLFEKEDGSGIAAAAIPDPSDNLVIGAILPTITAEQVNAVLYSSGWEGRIQALTRLASPDVLAARVGAMMRQGATIQQIAREIRPAVQGVQVVARRTARTAGLWIAHEAELHTYDQLGDMIEGYQIHAVLDHATRPEHRRRDGQKFYRVPRAGQKGFDQMPRPPREADGSWAFNCRCFLSPILR